MSQLFTPALPVLEALSAYEVKAVGGAVRSWLRKDPLTGLDIDLAINATPDQTEEALHAAAIPTSDAGKRWGTVTALLNGESFEITSLREDVYMPGSRYPTVNFITDWEADAHRRDFTINAIYLSPQEELYDPFDGSTDLRNGIVRFIGAPEVRLSEDPLRLYRFWRFCGHYGLGGVNADLIEVFRNALPGLISVSRSRRQTEWQKLQESPQGVAVVAELQRHDLYEDMAV
ncbi:MAG: hypothetical protein DI585_06615 [Pseudomonas fluorescens]|nr:MAG: hypothetical protein DI585_06615 [Pseudomonas fluorescens]